GVAFYNFLKLLPQKITMHNIGNVNSIANIIFMAGEERYAAPHSYFLFHGGNWNYTNASLTLEVMKENCSILEQNQETMKNIITENSSLSTDQVEALFLKGEAQDVNFAKENKIIDDIKDFKLPDNAIIINI